MITPKITKNRVMKETTAYIINDMLRSVVTNGTGTSAQIGNWAVAGKTGTTSLDPISTMAISLVTRMPGLLAILRITLGLFGWATILDPTDRTSHYLRNVYGGSFPAQIWKKVMTVALKDLPVQSKFAIPSGIVSGSFDTKSGLLPSSLTPADLSRRRSPPKEIFPLELVMSGFK